MDDGDLMDEVAGGQGRGSGGVVDECCCAVGRAGVVGIAVLVGDEMATRGEDDERVGLDPNGVDWE